ncbi:MAG: RagB/SusD family nutrient uptake outer membrane protein [Chitinophagaceae bacterium]
MSNKKLIILFASVIGLSACSKSFLEKAPDNRTELNTVEKVAQLVATAYPSYPYMAMGEMYSDNVCDKGPLAASVHTNTPYPEMYTYDVVQSTGNNSPTQYWNGVYEGIAAANQALEAIDEYKLGTAADPYKGEALLARAYGHFMLVTFFSKAYEIGGTNESPGIPYVTKPETVAIQDYSRGTVASVYEQIEKDIEAGLPLLGKGSWEVPEYHFTPSAAHAFATRFYLFKGEWQKVIDHANLVFPNGDYTGNLRNPVADASTLSSTDYAAWMNKATSKFNLLLHEAYSVYQRSSSFPLSRYGFGPSVYTGYFTTKTPTGAIFYQRAWSYATASYTLMKYNEFFYVTNATANTGYPYIMIPLLTSDEALLNRAEAYAQLGLLTNAIADCNTYAKTKTTSYSATTHAVTTTKSKAYFGVADDKQSIILTVLDFKRRGFTTEGLRWFDILRHKITVKHDLVDATGAVTNSIEVKADDNRRMFQIPETAQKLSNLSPNPR